MPERTRHTPSKAATIAGARAARALLREHGGWGRALRAAKAEGLLPLVAAAARAGAVSPPARFEVTLGRGARLGGLMAAVVAEAAAGASRALAARGVPHAVIKGAAVAPLYGDRALRPACDVDLLVGPADVPGAVEALAELGSPAGPSGAVETALSPSGRGALAVSLDLHHALAFPGQFAPDLDGMLARAGERGGMRVLAAEDEILVAAVNMVGDCFVAAGRSAADVAVISLAAAPDWEAVVRRAREWGLAAAAWAALGCARRSTGAAVPDEATRALRPSWAREAYLRVWLCRGRVSAYRLARRAGEWAPRRFAMAVLWPAFVDGGARRARFLIRYGFDKLRLAPASRPALLAGRHGGA